MKKQLQFYVQPFKQVEHSNRVYDGKNNFVFQFDEEIRYDANGNHNPEVLELRKEIIFALNSINHEPIESLNLTVGEYSNNILNNDELFITIRGWGNLTGSGSYNLSGEKASKIQNNFRDWLIYKLTKV